MAIAEIIGAVVAFFEEIEPIVKVIATVIEVLGPVIQKIGQALGLVEEDESCEDLGARALNAEEAGVTPEKFGSFEEYLNEVKKFPPETDRSMEDRLSMGTKLILGIINDKYPDFDPEILPVLAEMPELPTESWGTEIGKLLKNGTVSAQLLSDYFLNKPLSAEDVSKVDNELMKIEKTNNPGLSDGEAYKKIAGIRK